MKTKGMLVSIALLTFIGLIASKQFPGKSKTTVPEACSKSLLMQQTLRLQFFKILKEFEIHTLVHLPCGNMEWMHEMSLKVEKYIGADASKEVIEANRAAYGSQDHHFLVHELTRDILPKVDLIFCEEALHSLSRAGVSAALLLFKKSRATYLLTTHYPKLEANSKGKQGKFRPINFEIAPYHFPKPLLSIDLNAVEGKKLSLWKLDQLP